MDNRKVYKSYRDKVKTLTQPYSISNRKLSTKVKGLWNSIKSLSQPSSPPTPTTTAASSIEPFKFPEPQIRIPGSFHVDTTETAVVDKETDKQADDDANTILSNFFKEKGNKPLTDIEYEGVVSLLSKSKQQGKPFKRPHNIDNDDDTIDNSLVSNTTTNINKRQKFDAFSTPQKATQEQQQRHTLRLTPNVTINTPEYNPVYHTIHNDTFDRSSNASFISNRSIPSIKRVYQFSGLPSPYRTRIRAPSLTIAKRKHSRLNDKANKTMNNISMLDNNNNNTSGFTVPSSTTFTGIKPSAPTSSAAKTLLSILDGKDEHQPTTTTITQENNNNSVVDKTDRLKLFSNPYSSCIRPKKSTKVDKAISTEPLTAVAPIANKPISVTASDIEKTILFDKSEPLPSSITSTSATNKTEKTKESLFDNIEKKKETNGEKVDKLVPEVAKKDGEEKKKPSSFLSNNSKPSAGFTFGAFKATTTNQPNTSELNGNKLSSFGEKTNNHNNNTSKSAFSFGNNNNINKEIEVEKTLEKPKAMEKKQSISFGSTNGDLTKTSVGSSLGSSTGTATTSSTEFQFPEVEVVKVSLNQEEVEKYKSMFEF